VTRRHLALVAAIALVAAACGSEGEPIATGPAVTFATSSTAAPTSGPTTGPVSAPDTTGPATTPVATEAPTTVPLGDPSVGLAAVGAFDQPVDLAWRFDDPTLYVVERTGRVVPVRDGVAGAAVLVITDLTEGQGEQGLLGLTFSPDGKAAYVNHTDKGGDTIVAEYAVGADGTFDPASRRVLLTIEQPFPNHNGGNVTIGPDGMLYIGMGDGGAADDPQRTSLNVSSLLGKILRIDPAPSGDQPYGIPADNPFVGVDGARPEIWAVGVRNPWRFSFDSATGDLWIADVGQNVLEEIDVAWAADGGGRGMNFGWSAWEGSQRYNTDQPADGATPPIYEYEHGDAGCSVSGGEVYRGAAVPALVGWYVFADFCSGIVTGLRIADRAVASSLTLGQVPSAAAVRSGPDGELYVVSIEGPVSRLVPS
jgi:glucose/arabinose dehydrogenase